MKTIASGLRSVAFVYPMRVFQNEKAPREAGQFTLRNRHYERGPVVPISA
jgi:hypothetical protein